MWYFTYDDSNMLECYVQIEGDIENTDHLDASHLIKKGCRLSLIIPLLLQFQGRFSQTFTI